MLQKSLGTFKVVYNRVRHKVEYLLLTRRACQHSKGASMRINQTRPHLKMLILMIIRNMLMLMIIRSMLMLATKILLVPTLVPQFNPSSWAALSERPLATCEI